MRTLRLLACATMLVPATALGQAVPGSPTDLLVGHPREARPVPRREAPTPDRVVTVPDQVASAGTVKGVVFDGVDPPAKVARAGQPFLGKPITLETIQGLARSLSDAYGESSIALFTVSVPAQNFGGGIVHVRIVEGYIERTLLAGDTDEESIALVKSYAAAMTGKRPLAKRTLQRYLSLIRDIPGLTADAQLVPGQGEGAVRLVLTLKQKDTDVALSYNNLTQRALADGQFQAAAKLYGGLRAGDITSLTLSSATDFKAFRYAGLSHATPLGDGALLSAAYGRLSTRSRGLDLRGNADVASVGVSYPLIRGYERNVTLGATLDGVNSDNAVLGALVTRERTRAFRLTAALSEAKGKHAVSASLIGAQGLDILGADSALTANDLGFTKLGASISAAQGIGDDFAVRLDTAAQLSASPLPSVERFLIGGDHFGRAFPVATLAGDQGTAASLELAWQPLKSKAFGASELYVFGDRAAVKYHGRGPFAGQSFNLASAGAGIKLAFRNKGMVRAELARRVDQPFPSDDKWQVNVAWRLSLGR